MMGKSCQKGKFKKKIYSYKSLDRLKLHGISFRHAAVNVLEQVTDFVSMTDSPDTLAQVPDAVVILCGRVHSEAIQKGLPTSAGILSTLNDSLKTVPEELVGPYL